MWIAALLLACSSSSTEEGHESPEPPADDSPRDTLVIGVASDLTTLNPVLSRSSQTDEYAARLYLPLVRGVFDCNWQFSPGIAESWTWSEGGTVLTLTLDDDLHWSDGTPLTSADVRFTFDLIGNPEVASRFVEILEPLAGPPETPSPTTVVLRYREAPNPMSAISSIAEVRPIPTHRFAETKPLELSHNPESTKPTVVSGPWQLAKHEPNARFVFTPNAAFDGPEALSPKTTRLLFRILPEYSTRLLELKNGTIDMMMNVGVGDLAELPDTVRTYKRGWRNLDVIGWNHEDPRFASADVRRALTMAIDHPRMVRELMSSGDEAYATPAFGPFPPARCDLVDDTLKPLPHDPEGAKALLAAAGWTDSDGDGKLDKDGEPFRIEMMLESGSEHRRKAAIFVKDDLSRIGIEVDLMDLAFAARNKRLKARDYEAALFGWSGSLGAPPINLLRADPPDGRRQGNWVGYANPEIDRLLDAGLATVDPDDANEIWLQVQRTVYADQPYTFLWWRNEVTGIDARFTGVDVGPAARLGTLEQWAVAPDAVKYR